MAVIKKKWVVSISLLLIFTACKRDYSHIKDAGKITNNSLTVQLTDTVQTFTTITWATAKSQPVATHEVHGEVVNGKLYIFGGYDIYKRPRWTPTKRSYVYDPVSNTWSSIADLPQTPNGSGFGGITHVGLTNDGADIYFAGGYTSNANGTGQLFGTRQVWKYTVATNSYSRLPDLPKALAAGQMRYLNGKLHFMGGADSLRNDVGLHYALDLNNLSAGWTTLAPLLNAVNHPGSAVLGGKIYFLGGSHHQDANSIAQKTLEVYDETTNLWKKLADMPLAVDHISSAVIVIGSRLIYLGGETSHNVLSSGVYAYSPASDSWEKLTSLPEGKSAGVAAALNNNIYYTGGNFSTVNHKGLPNYNEWVSLSPVADAFVRNGSYSSQNYGSDTLLFVKGATVSNYTRISYIKFSLSGLSNVTGARLRIYGYNSDNSQPVSLSCYAVNDDSWAENSINFNNAPPAAATALSTANVNSQMGYIDFDVTSFVSTQLNADKTVSLQLKDNGMKNAALIFHSRESTANKPQLLISY